MKKAYLNLSFNSSEFHSIALKFKNLSGKIDALLSTGKFWEFSKTQQQRLLTRLLRLFEKLSGFDLKYALKIAGAALCFTLISGAAKALPTFNDFNPNNPFTFSTILGSQNLAILDGAFADVDGDGDLDAVLLTASGAAYFENVNGQYIENSADNPFKYSWVCGTYSGFNMVYGQGIDMADFDGDGDLDAIVIYSGHLSHYQLNSAGKFIEVSGSDINNNWSSELGYRFQVKFGDVDGDGDLDIVSPFCSAGGTYVSTLLQQSNHSFSQSYNYPVTGTISISPVYSVHINLADMDGDGDDDLFVFNSNLASPGLALPSSGASIINYFMNTPGSGVFSRVTSGIPLPPDLSLQYFPLLADLDGDGDIDIFTPSDGGASNFQNLSASPVPISPLVALIAFAATGFGIFRKNRKKKTE